MSSKSRKKRKVNRFHLKELSKNPEFKAALHKALADSKAKTERLKEARKIEWVCTCHKDDFCILHTRFM